MANKDTELFANKTIYLSIEESDYEIFMTDKKYARRVIDDFIKSNIELFPLDINKSGYILNGKTNVSKKQGIAMRRIKIGMEVFQICPSFVFPYMVGKTDELEKALFLCKFHVPFWAIAYVFDKDPKYWYRIYCRMGNYNMVGTTIKHPENLPKNILADEQHIVVMGEKAYIATTVGGACFLGAEVSESASETALKNAYGTFKDEIEQVKSGYSPDTVNTDGWSATQKAWKGLFPLVVILQCFLHAFIKIRDRALKKQEDIYRTVSEKVWNAYRAETKRSFSQYLRHLKKWAEKSVPDSIMKSKLLDLCAKRRKWTTFYDYPQAHRTSNALDRLMKFMSRHLYMHQNYHSDIKHTTVNIRAYCLIYNFAPFNPWTIKRNDDVKCPAEKINGFVFHENWLHNFLISTSLQHRYFIKQQKMT
jgi:hypothetical protein